MKAHNTIDICVYRDSTGLYSEEECYRYNMEYFLFSEDILRSWYKSWYEQNEDWAGEISFEDWLDEYDCDYTDGLYAFAVEHGYTPVATGSML